MPEKLEGKVRIPDVYYGVEYSVTEITSREQFVGKEHIYEFAALDNSSVKEENLVKVFGSSSVKERTLIEAFGILVLPGSVEERQRQSAITPKELGLIVIS